MMAILLNHFPHFRSGFPHQLRKCGETRETATFHPKQVRQGLPNPGEFEAGRALARTHVRTGFNPSPFQGVDNKTSRPTGRGA